ncbi:YqeG family HAD IIIA-type phosphatase [Longirhabdus pacifica]|uniref:YqeG family HAD IIIA-type phosphatase n=1 Tax=Longirhabdus pacifica TaxID=2305227 RepID=UPI0010090632|nr:YqeG family HAD IIIA-type phosphatase [Longirhabdus pacifica]
MLTKFVPSLIVNSIYDIDLVEFKKKGYNAIIVDLDNTLVGSNEAYATPELEKWFEQAKAHHFKVMVVSNNKKKRVSAFAEPLQVPFIYQARKPIASAFIEALSVLDAKPEQTMMVGDQLLTDVLGGNRQGMFTILVNPVSNVEGVMTRVNRKVERIIKSRLKKKGHRWGGTQ